MENIITKTSQQFGTIRTIEGTPQLWCGIDVAKALGYSNTRDAVIKHCRCVVKRDVPHPQSKSKLIEMVFIPEADVYRLICHSKLPKAQEFEKWVFEDIVPEAVHDCRQMTFDDYEYFSKTYKGQLVLTSMDISRFTGIKHGTVNWHLHNSLFSQGVDYHRLEGAELQVFKIENPKYDRRASCVNVITKSGFDKLKKLLRINCTELANSFEHMQPQPQYSPHSSMISLLGYIERQTILISEYRRRLLGTCTRNEAEMYRNELVKALKDLKWYVLDTETIRI